jgi:hypothetical protein
MQLFAFTLFCHCIPISALIADKIENVDLCYYCNRFWIFFSYFLNSECSGMVTFFMHRYGFDGIYGPLGTFLSIISYYGAVFRCVINV